jgi:L-alanine-DL-glutamate epimerase-like enolase superfamily enzyme
MKITDVQVHLVESTTTDDFRWRDGLPGSDPSGVAGWLEISTDQGISGYAGCHRGKLLEDYVERRWRGELIGQDPFMREHFWHRLWELDRIEYFPVYMLGLVDIALWDIAGKALEQPVWRLLGGAKTSIRAYASTVTFSSTAEYLDVADQCLALGYPAIKLHAWGDARRDAELCLALRAHVGANVPLMYDGSAGFDLQDAVYLGHALSEAGYLWYEEPMKEHNIDAYQRLSERVRVPLLVAEVTNGSHWTTADFIKSGCASSVRTSAGFKGGFTGALRVAHLAEAHQLRAEMHGAGLENAHLCMSVRNNTYYESLVKTNPVVREARVDSSGLVHAPLGHGVGYELEWQGSKPWKRVETKV